MQLGYLSANNEVRHDSAGRIEVLCTDPAAGLEEGARSARDEAGNVRGSSGKIFPQNGPGCKYSALFDPNPSFDALREAFMIFGDPNSKADTFVRLLMQQVAGRKHLTFTRNVQTWIAAATSDCEPMGFGVRAWSAYLSCVQDKSYYFSVDELLAMCCQAATRVIVMKEVDGVLTFAGSCLNGYGPLIVTKLNANDQAGSVRSHFERIIPKSRVLEFSSAMEAEVSERRRQEELDRRERAEKRVKEEAERKANQEAAAKTKQEDAPPPPPASDGQRPANKKKKWGGKQQP